MRHPMRSACVAAWAAIALSGPAAAAPPEDGPASGGGPRRPPPPEAIEACKSAASGKACSFTDARGAAVSGSCWAPEGRPLACRPKKDAPPAPDGAASRPARP